MVDEVSLSYKDKTVTLGKKASRDEPGHLTSGLIRAINADVADALGKIERRDKERITLTCAITVGRDKEDEVVILYKRRGATLESGRLQVAPTGQGQLLEEE